MTDWEGFGRAIMEEWQEHFDVDAGDKFELAVKFGVLVKIPGGFDPEQHCDENGDAERGDPWYKLSNISEGTP